VKKLAYGLLFAIMLPALLIVWSRRLDALSDLRPAPCDPRFGLALATIGALVIIIAVVDLRRFGRGWPMSPFPPERRVSRGMYALFSDPIYTGSVAMCAGVAIAWRSGAGIWLATPLLALACIAFVTGYEHDATRARFGAPPQRPFFNFVEPSPFAIYFVVLLPWLLAFEAVNAFGVPHDAINGWSRLDAHIPMLPWTEPVYFLDYPLVLAVPLLIRNGARLKTFAQRGWIATIAVTLFYLCVPVVVPPRPVPGTGMLQTLMLWERRFDAPVTAFPAFHVIWAVIAAAAFGTPLAWIVAIAISISCLTTGMHTIADVVAGAIFAIAILNARAIARFVIACTERLANSWREWDYGVIRVMSHGIYAALGATFGVLLVATFAGGMTRAVILVAASTIVGAALWAQFIEGSPQLLRPYGYYGGLLGACIAIRFTHDPWRMLAAYAVAAPLVQAFGRLRCLVQGCCHGRRFGVGQALSLSGSGKLESLPYAIRYTHPRSRVTRLAELANQPLHATQLYSILGSVVSLVILVRMWIVGAPLQWIAGTSFILAGLVRFVEEHFRGEPQTRIVGGLRIYQWLAIGSVLAGAAMMAAGNTPAPPPVALGMRDVAIALLTGAATYIAYGVDFPRLNTRFARLV
jgi:hypothetical protein